MTVSLAAKAFVFPLAVASMLQIALRPALAESASVAQSTTPTGSTVFECIPTDTSGRYATIARRGQLVSPPMITWEQVQYYTPQQRCQIVSGRLNGAVQANGGRFGNLLLTYGSVNSQPVICYVGSRTDTCNTSNVLLTLAPEDRGQELAILRQLVTFGTEASGGPLLRRPTRHYADLGSQLEQYLGADEESSEGL
ncbi:COP23 domain-containing protein [Oculatella sp. LEGE 06141]|uniref:COP23 domain-containing protein n=1 Tax=Oculatella sp. LEGE 06141 TaxID=1828648 RepID=UPI00187E6DA9|nr:COP23 domain-containing protein [Oculatella sp. LEGE 06141]